MARQPRKRPGRPARELEPGERVPMSFRVRPELKRRMDAAAAESGRSVAQEIELRLERSFEREALLLEVLELRYGSPLAGLLMAMGAAMDGAGRSAAILAQLDL